VGTPDRQGPLGVGLTSLPVGWANVTGAPQPDLFAVAGRHSFPAGLFLYPWKGVTRDGIPVFGARWVIDHPGKSGVPPICTVVQAHGGIWAFIVEGVEVIAAQFGLPRRAFGEVYRVPLTGLPRSPEAIAALPQPGAKWLFVLAVSDGKAGRPPGADARDRDYFPYDVAGIWRGGTARCSLWALIPGTPPRPLTRPGEEILHQTGRLTTGRFGIHSGTDLISGSRFGDIYYYRNAGKDGLALEPRRHAVDEEGVVLRHPVTGA